MKTRRIILTLAVMLVMLLAFTSCDAFSGLIPEAQCEHTWEEATCTVPKTCSLCGETEGEALGHTEEIVAGKEATCTNNGFTDGKICTVCNAVTVPQEEISAKGHTAGAEATCEDSQICTVCNVELAPALGHKVGPDATCEADQECTVCHEILVSAYGHVAGAAATCTEIQECLVCHTELAPAKGHVPGAEPTCVDAQICTVCNAELAPANGHTAGAEATCEVAQTCTVCNVELAPAKGHDYVAEYVWTDDCTSCTVTATCTKDASHVITETATVAKVELNVGAGKSTNTYTVVFAGMSLGEKSKTIDIAHDVANGIATVFAPTVVGKVASHDFVKVGMPTGDEIKTFTFYYSEISVWDGTSVSTALEGEGTEENPYLIQSAADFAYFAGVLNAVEGAAGVNNQVKSFNGQYVKMTKSIDLDGHYLIAGFHSGWNNYQGFFGHFDGNNCSIRGLAIDNSKGTTSTALFGCINGGSLQNLSVYGTVKGNATTGGIVAYSLSGAVLENLTSYIDVTSAISGTRQGTVGGVVANQENSAGALINCVNYGNVICDSYIVGGIVGSGGAAMTGCVNWGIVTGGNVSVGGIAGSTKDKGTISGCVNYGKISSTSATYGKVAGIAGSCVKPVDNCVNYGEISAVEFVGGICGESTKAITNCVNYGEVIIRNCTKTSIDGICSSNVTKTDCANHGTLTVAHVLTHVEANAPACEVAGNVEYDKCLGCEKNFDAEGNELASVEVAPLEHDYNAVVTDPTCDKDGFTTHTCKLCGKSYTDSVVNGGHKDENSDLKCDACGTNLCVDHVPAEAVKENEVKATCEANGSYESVVKCSVCSFEISRDTVSVPALGHKMDDGTVEGTVKTYACVNGCGKTEVKYLVSVNYLFLDGSVAAEADVTEYNNGEYYTINAKSVNGYVASHDYVKGHIDSKGSVINIYYSEISVWDGTSVSASLAGSGTQADPYLIQSAADFAYFAGVLNAVEGAAGINYKVTSFKGQYVKMTKSIDLDGHNLIAGFHSGWNNYQGFFGHFDGNNCSIRNINVSPTTGASSALFGCINTGSLKNLSVYGNVTGKATVGGVVAYTTGNAVVENVTSYVTVTQKGTGNGTGTVGGVVANQENSAGALINCVNYGDVTGESYIVGGIVGSGGAAMTGCVNWGTISSTASDVVGGITGTTKDKGTISGCVNYGTISGGMQVGGIAGKSVKAINNCANYGNVTGRTKLVGGIAGEATVAITGSVNNAVVQGNTQVGGITGSTVATNGCVDNGEVVIK